MLKRHSLGDRQNVAEKTHRVWLFLSNTDWQLSLEREAIIETLNKPDDHIYFPAYFWLKNVLKKKVPDFTAEYPLLTWLNPRRPGRTFASAGPSESGYYIFCDIPRSRSVILNAEAWTCVVNQWYLPASDEDDADFESEAPIGATSVDGLTGLLEKRVRDSWHRVFDLNAMKNEYGRRTYAFTDRVPIESVIRVERFFGT